MWVKMKSFNAYTIGVTKRKEKKNILRNNGIEFSNTDYRP